MCSILQSRLVFQCFHKCHNLNDTQNKNTSTRYTEHLPKFNRRYLVTQGSILSSQDSALDVLGRSDLPWECCCCGLPNLSGTPIECAVRASPKCSDPEPHTDRHSLVYHRLWTSAITSSLYGLKIIPKSVTLIDALFVFLRYTFFLIWSHFLSWDPIV